MTEQSFRREPYNLEAEQALLGAILINNEAHDRVSDLVKPEHFRVELHQQIFDTAAKMIAAGDRADPITLKPFFESAASVEPGVTAVAYLGILAARAATVINARDYGQTVYDLAVRRHLIVIAEDVLNTAYDSPVDFSPREQIEELETRLFSLAEAGKYGQGFTSFEGASSKAVTAALAARKRGGVSGLATGLRDLDSKLGGLQPTDLIILAGRPSMGKTALATNIAYNAARARARSLRERPVWAADHPSHAGAVVGFFSLEMSDEQLATRILAERIGVSSDRIRRGLINNEEERRLIAAQRELASIPLHIDQTGAISIAQLAARARRLKRQKGLGLIIVDYLQQATGTSKSKGGGRVQEVGEITTGLKALAKELNVPVLALSQLNRAVENREDKRPQLADLRESGSIEQDADVVMFAFREEYYVERAKPVESSLEYADWLAKMNEVGGKAEVIIGKQRHGPVGTVQLKFEPELTRFSNLARQSEAERARSNGHDEYQSLHERIAR